MLLPLLLLPRPDGNVAFGKLLCAAVVILVHVRHNHAGQVRYAEGFQRAGQIRPAVLRSGVDEVSRVARCEQQRIRLADVERHERQLIIRLRRIRRGAGCHCQQHHQRQQGGKQSFHQETSCPKNFGAKKGFDKGRAKSFMGGFSRSLQATIKTKHE